MPFSCTSSQNNELLRRFTEFQIARDLRFAIRITNRNRSQIARFGALRRVSDILWLSSAPLPQNPVSMHLAYPCRCHCMSLRLPASLPKKHLSTNNLRAEKTMTATDVTGFDAIFLHWIFRCFLQILGGSSY